MNDSGEFWKKNSKSIYYKIKDFSCVSDRLIECLEWPDSIPTLSIVFNTPIKDEHLILKNKISDKYSARLVYFNEKTEIIVPKNVDLFPNLRVKEDVSIEEVRQLYLSSVMQTFTEEFPGKIPEARMKFSENVAQNYLSVEKSFCLELDGVDAGILTMVGITDYNEHPIECVNWVWLKKDLSLNARIYAQYMIAMWLRRTVYERVNCYVDSFNLRSQKFFRRMGFAPKCLIIEKRV